MLLAICADRGAPGSTTTALALAAARGLPAVVVEADPYGGDLALRVRPHGKQPLPATPTVLGVSAGRSAQQLDPRTIGMPHGGGPDRRHRDLWRDGAHQLSDLVRVVPGFPAAEQGTSMSWPVLASALASQTVPIFTDLGRIHTGSPSLPIATAADALITVCRGDMASVHHMVDRLELMVPAIADRNGRPPLVVPVVVAPRQHGAQIAGSIAKILSETAVEPALRGVGWLAWDPAAVDLLEHGADPWGRSLKKSPLMRSAQQTIALLGMATGMEHSVPATRRALGSRRGDDRQSSGTESKSVQAYAHPQSSVPVRDTARNHPGSQKPPQPSPPLTWPEPGAMTRPRPGMSLAERLGVSPEQQATADTNTTDRWETAAWEEQH